MTQDSKFAMGSILFVYGVGAFVIDVIAVCTLDHDVINIPLAGIILVVGFIAAFYGYKAMKEVCDWRNQHLPKPRDLKGFTKRLYEENCKAIDAAIAYPSEENRTRRDTYHRVFVWLEEFNLLDHSTDEEEKS